MSEAKQLFVPQVLVAEVQAPGAGREALEWDSALHHDSLSQANVARFGRFLEANGLDPQAFMLGNEVTVRVRSDGSLWLDTWVAVRSDGDDPYPLCENCPHCVKQKRVVVPLVAQVPAALATGFVDPLLHDCGIIGEPEPAKV